MFGAGQVSRPERYRCGAGLTASQIAVDTIGDHRHGQRSQSLLGTFEKVPIAVPRARLDTADGRTLTYQRRTLAADALIAGCYLAGTNTRQRRALGALFADAVREGHGEPCVAQGEERLGRLECPLVADEPIVRLILDSTVVRVRLDRKATAISLLVVIGVRADG